MSLTLIAPNHKLSLAPLIADHISNTRTGFSGTLFQSKSNPNEYVISFRSTEFIDDAIRDGLATNSIGSKGSETFAFVRICGQ